MTCGAFQMIVIAKSEKCMCLKVQYKLTDLMSLFLMKFLSSPRFL